MKYIRVYSGPQTNFNSSCERGKILAVSKVKKKVHKDESDTAQLKFVSFQIAAVQFSI